MHRLYPVQILGEYPGTFEDGGGTPTALSGRRQRSRVVAHFVLGFAYARGLSHMLFPTYGLCSFGAFTFAFVHGSGFMRVSYMNMKSRAKRHISRVENTPFTVVRARHGSFDVGGGVCMRNTSCSDVE
jgi:hypothetical protein